MKTTARVKNVREVVIDLLLQIEKNQAYSNLLLNQAIKQHQVTQKDIGLLTEIVYGTIQRKLTLDYFIAPYIQKQKKLDDWVRVLLRMTVYQMHYLDRVPDRAAIFEAVEIAKRRGHKGISSMVNGVLRSLQREGFRSLEEIQDPVERVAVETSFPTWMVERWTTQYGLEETRKLCEETLLPPVPTARVNCSSTSIEEVSKKLEDEGIHVKPGVLSEDAIMIEKGNFANTNAFKQGLLTIQDESSMLVGRAVSPKKDDLILDSCAAPGGKTTHISELLHHTGKVISVDLHDHKVKLINEQVTRLHLTNVETLVMDSRKLAEKYEDETFDKILVDAPCSGLGVIRRKPDIKYQKDEKDIESLASIQYRILEAIAPLLKKGGTLIYSTCTMDQEENDQVVKKFLLSHTNFERDTSLLERLPEKIRGNAEHNGAQIQILPHHFGTDGFFISSLRKQV
ncbi:16S rRNA (cytosine(967)-C(5))-methyltransferase RsmB [Bacillus pinisoli]|uniref:16S rRNA (cytosine(967)-C(5))-methyltransferase RsmB n=1 Tax=Bacillus pinisoli TaxID=2901866 RepID=UPI001FF68614|nr:16S rRNA (cytosine(967)-C(5))-methyltransferase RsmB [Bacillus pinisoli]